MRRPRLPWRTDEDTQAEVLDWVIRQAVRRPEIASELAPGGDEDEATAKARKVISENRASVIASAEDAELRYFELARSRTNPKIDWIERHPRVGELITLGVIPAAGLILLPASAELFGYEGPWLPMVLVALQIGLLVSGLMLLHKRSRNSVSIPARSWAALSLIFSGVGCTVVFFDSAPPLWFGFEILLIAAIVAVFTALTAVFTTVFPSKRDKLRERAEQSAHDEWLRTLLRDGVLPVLISKINTGSQQTYSTMLTAPDTRALTRANPLTMHVPTPASRRLAQLADQLSGGSFALAGPRGAGKSNLLKAFCGGRYREDKRHPDLAVLVSAPVEYVPYEFVLHLFGTTCRATINYPGRLAGLAAAARENLDLLNYVHSYAREITAKGGFKGFELGRKRGVTLQGRALTYPELVDRFRDFLRDAANALITESKRDSREPGRVVIGIDELDRLGSGEPARRFLNELKAIFDVPGCYYLVSVSTEAQHDFELSGMGVRSVFDSSFDEIVRVDYLGFEDAKELLRRYVIGLSEQFLALAYVFSGGLARQLVRTARLIIEHAGESLPAVAQDLAKLEMTRTCQASADVLASADDGAELLRVLDDPPAKVAGAELLSYANRVSEAYQGGSEMVRALRDSVTDRMYFLAAVLDLFTNELTEHRMQGVDFDTLARARRYLRG